MKIYLDYDMTLVDLHTPWLKVVNQKFKVNITTKDIVTYTWVGDTFGPSATEFFRTKGIYENDLVLPLEGSKDFVNFLISIVGKDNVYVISDCMIGHYEEKKEHVFRHYHINNFVNSYDRKKSEFTKDGILIDDNPHYVEDHVNTTNNLGILFNMNFDYGWAKLPYESKLIEKCGSYHETKYTIANELRRLNDRIS